jgi:hypothetical protein
MEDHAKQFCQDVGCHLGSWTVLNLDLFAHHQFMGIVIFEVNVLGPIVARWILVLVDGTVVIEVENGW